MYFISRPEWTLIVFLWVSAPWEWELRPDWNVESPGKTHITHNARQNALHHKTKDIFRVIFFLHAPLNSPEKRRGLFKTAGKAEIKVPNGPPAA